MPARCNPESFGFAALGKRKVEAAFDGGVTTSDAGALLLGATDRAIRLVSRFAGCFKDGRMKELVEHEVATLVGQRVFGLAMGYEDLNDHDTARAAIRSWRCFPASLQRSGGTARRWRASRR